MKLVEHQILRGKLVSQGSIDAQGRPERLVFIGLFSMQLLKTGWYIIVHMDASFISWLNSRGDRAVDLKSLGRGFESCVRKLFFYVFYLRFFRPDWVQKIGSFTLDDNDNHDNEADNKKTTKDNKTEDKGHEADNK